MFSDSDRFFLGFDFGLDVASPKLHQGGIITDSIATKAEDLWGRIRVKDYWKAGGVYILAILVTSTLRLATHLIGYWLGWSLASQAGN